MRLNFRASCLMREWKPMFPTKTWRDSFKERIPSLPGAETP